MVWNGVSDGPWCQCQWVERSDGAVSVVGVESTQGVESVDDVRREVGVGRKSWVGVDHRKCGTPKQRSSTV